VVQYILEQPAHLPHDAFNKPDECQRTCQCAPITFGRFGPSRPGRVPWPSVMLTGLCGWCDNQMATRWLHQRLRLRQRSQASPTSMPRSMLTHMSVCVLQSGFCHSLRHHHLRTRGLHHHSRRRRQPSLIQRPTVQYMLLAPQQQQCAIGGSTGGTVSPWGERSPAKNDAPASGTQQPAMSCDGVFL
jgi:hypothetical protein